MDFYPNPATKCFYNILKHANLILDEPVNILTEYPQEDDIPCVSMIDTPSGIEPVKSIYYNYGFLPETHPYYDPDHPDIEYKIENQLKNCRFQIISSSKIE